MTERRTTITHGNSISIGGSLIVIKSKLIVTCGNFTLTGGSLKVLERKTIMTKS
jgi:hypothetical protein